MKGASIKIATVFPQYFRQGRPLNQVILMTILIEKSQIKSIASRVRSNSFYWAFKDVDPRLIGIVSDDKRDVSWTESEKTIKLDKCQT